ncbi:MAG: M28 family peptidase [Longimicrobiales bacterium]
MPSKLRGRTLWPAVFATLLAVLPSETRSQTTTDPYVGFTSARALEQGFCEARLLELPSSQAFREHLRIITSAPHPAGSAAQVEVGNYLTRVMKAAGLDVVRHTYDVYLPQLTDDVEAWIATPERIRLSNREPALPEDRFSHHPDLLNGWNAFSGSGDVTGEVVYANFGRREDYEALDSMGIDLTDRIVIARYGGNFRGYKVKFAEERGAAGVIMFNDPGFSREGAYPEGPMMNGETIQRGSVLTLPWTGDPLTPFEPALPVSGERGHVERLDPDDVAMPTIPVLPLGYLAAEEILSRMDGPEAPEGWAGGVDVDYRLTGGSDLTVRVRVNQPRALTRAVNVVGTVVGSDFPNEWVILGAHYDPWGFGAIDPNGGTAMLLTLAEALGQLADEGCRPRRSILIAHWDAEEAGIIGSTEWVEEFMDPLTVDAVAYINADGAVSGPNFGGSSSPSLKSTILDVLDDVMYPGRDMTVYEWWTTEAGGSELGNLGGGSDHVAFYTHAGVPSAGLSTGAPSGVYHSNYDNFAWFERFGDTEFVFGPMLARVDGLVALRLANADVLPFDVVRYATDTRVHVQTLLDVADARRVDVDLSRLVDATTELEAAAERFVAARDASLEGDAAALVAPVAQRTNRVLRQLEKAWLDDGGLQDRPWSRNLYVSPDPFSGYASWMLPGVRFEIETDDPAEVPEWEEKYLRAIVRLSGYLDQATAELSR